MAEESNDNGDDHCILFYDAEANQMKRMRECDTINADKYNLTQQWMAFREKKSHKLVWKLIFGGLALAATGIACVSYYQNDNAETGRSLMAMIRSPMLADPASMLPQGYEPDSEDLEIMERIRWAGNDTLPCQFAERGMAIRDAMERSEPLFKKIEKLKAKQWSEPLCL